MRTLAEDLLLLALDDDKGTVDWQYTMSLPNGLGGALLMDLVLLERIEIDEKKVTVTDPSPTGDEILDDALHDIHTSKRQHDAKHWVYKLGSKSGLQDDLARRLVDRGILEEHERTYLWVFTRRRFPEVNPEPEAMLREDIHDIVLSDEDPDARTLLLLSLIHACDLYASLFAKDERDHAKARTKSLVEGEKFGAAVGSVISDVTTTIMAATIATTAAAASSTTSSG